MMNLDYAQRMKLQDALATQKCYVCGKSIERHSPAGAYLHALEAPEKAFSVIRKARECITNGGDENASM